MRSPVLLCVPFPAVTPAAARATSPQRARCSRQLSPRLRPSCSRRWRRMSPGRVLGSRCKIFQCAQQVNSPGKGEREKQGGTGGITCTESLTHGSCVLPLRTRFSPCCCLSSVWQWENCLISDHLWETLLVPAPSTGHFQLVELVLPTVTWAFPGKKRAHLHF